MHLRCCDSEVFSGSDRMPAAGPSAAWVAAGRVPAWFSVSSLGQRWPWRGLCSAFAVADRGCATKALRRGGRRVEVLPRPPTARAGWRRSRPGRDSSVFLPARARMGLRSREALLWRAVAAIASLHGYPHRRVADQVAVGKFGQRFRAGEARWVAGRWGRPGRLSGGCPARSRSGRVDRRRAGVAGASPAALLRTWSAS
jgi:hypothetical protein